MPETTETKKPTDAERLREAARQMNGQQFSTINMLTEMVIKLSEEVEQLKARSIRTVVKIK